MTIGTRSADAEKKSDRVPNYVPGPGQVKVAACQPIGMLVFQLVPGSTGPE